MRAVELLAAAGRSVAALQARLQDPAPGTLEEIQPLLESAIAHLQALHAAIAQRSAPPAHLRGLAFDLRREVTRVKALLESYARFCIGWAGMLDAGYTAQGGPRAPAPRPRIVLEG